MKINLNREVLQYTPDLYKECDSARISYKVFGKLLKETGLTWDDIEYIYLFVSEDYNQKSRVVTSIMYYFQGSDGHYDYKYMKGLDFLIPVRNLHLDMSKFFRGDYE